MDKIKNPDIVLGFFSFLMVLGDLADKVVSDVSLMAQLPWWAFFSILLAAAIWRYHWEQTKGLPALTPMEETVKDEFVRQIAAGASIEEALRRAQAAATDPGDE